MREPFQRALDVLVPPLLNPLYRALTGDRGARYRLEVERFNRRPAGEIRARQLERLRALCAHAAARSPLYTGRFREAGIADPARVTWEQYRALAPLTRRDLNRRRDEILVSGADRDRLRPTATGGTTSSPVPLYLDWDAVFRRQSATEVFDRWLGYRPGLRIAYLWGAARDFAHPSLRSRVEAAIFKRFLFLPSSPLDEDILDGYERALRAFRPVLLQAYPTPLTIFAEHLLARGRTLPLPAIACTAEPLLDAQREPIERAFGVRPFVWYGARECGRIATECAEHRGLHINAYGLVVETEEEPAPETGSEFLVTDLWNRSFPILRYAIGDLGVLENGRCACGSELPRIREVTGRTADVFLNTRGQKIPGVAFTNRLITGSREFRSVQVVQRALKRFEVLFVPGSGYAPESERALTERLAEYMGEEEVEVTFVRVDEIPREPSGKKLFCRNAMDGETE